MRRYTVRSAPYVDSALLRLCPQIYKSVIMRVDCEHYKDPFLQKVGLASVGIFQVFNKKPEVVELPFLDKVRLWTRFAHGK